MDHREIAGLMAAIAPTIGDFVGKAIAPLRAENERLSKLLLDMEGRLTGIATEREQAAAAVLQLVHDEIANSYVASFDAVSIDRLVTEKVAEAVAALPAPPAGEPGESVTAADLAPLVSEQVAAAVAALPAAQPGRDGKDADPAQIVAEVERAVAALPRPENGRDADPALMEQMVAEQLARAIAAQEPPRDGTSVTLEDVRPMVCELVEQGFAALPQLPAALLVNDAGELVAVYAAGEQKTLGKVRGADGARGSSVMDGRVDEDGVLVLRMSDGRMLQAGTVRGKDGIGLEGKPGRNGRDAAELHILPGIDETRSYPEGICARWCGGLIRSERQTAPLIDGDIVSAGWSVILEGIAQETETDIDDGRFIERTTVYTSGRTFSRRLKTAVPIDRGVWKEGEFLKGDGVSHGGSFFVAQRDTSDKPQLSDAWRLAVKRGRDGRDGALPAARPATVKVS